MGSGDGALSGLKMKKYFLLIALSAVLASPALADDRTARAKAQFEKGEVQYRLGKFRVALGHYHAALKLVRRPSIVYNIAQCHLRLGELKKALFNYELFLADYRRANPASPTPHNHAEVQRHIKDLKARIARAEAEAAAKAKVEAEAAAKARTEAAAKAREEAAAKAREEAAAKAREEAAARARAEGKKPQAAKPGSIRLVGVTAAKARVYVDRVARAAGPVTKPIQVASCKRLVQVTAPGFSPWHGRINVPPGATVDLVVTLQPHEEPGHKTAWLVLSITALALAAGAEATAIVFAGKANEHYTGTGPWEDDRTISIAGHTVAGIMGAASVASFIAFLLSGSPERPAAAASVTPLPGGAAFVGVFRF